MQHVTDEDLVLHLYGEQRVAHLEECPECRTRFQELQRVMNVAHLPVPERDRDYESQVWTRLEPKLGLRRKSWLMPFFRVAAVCGMAAVIVVAFLAGRYSQTPSSPVAAESDDRVLTAAVRDHLERSEMVLTEIANEGQGTAATAAEALVTPNRVYRLSAAGAGDQAIAALLDDLERLLLEAVHSPDTVDRRQLRDVLFRLRVASMQLREENL